MRGTWPSILLLAVVGCGVKPLSLDRSKLVDGPVGWETAQIVTCEDFEIGDCPAVYWYGPASMDCADGAGFRYDGGCSTGIQGGDGILLGLTALMQRPSQTPIVHELAHWKWGDEHHANLAIWGPGGETTAGQNTPGTRVGDQNAALATAGL